MEHPMVTEINTYGYPLYMLKEKPIVCEECGDTIDEDMEDIYFDENHEVLCKRCLLHLHKKEY